MLLLLLIYMGPYALAGDNISLDYGFGPIALGTCTRYSKILGARVGAGRTRARRQREVGRQAPPAVQLLRRLHEVRLASR